MFIKLVFAVFVLAGVVVAQPVKSVVPEVARPLPLTAVRLTGGPLKRAQDLNVEYLLKLEPDRMMSYFYQRAGLKPKAEGYGGWDGDGKNLTGHIAGHYLSAVSFMYAATGDARFKERADYIVREMKIVQDKHGDGYLGALANGKERFNEVAKGDIRSSNFDLNGLWSPWYTLHKIYAGLRDAYRFTGNKTALELEIKFAAWAEGILTKLDEAQTQKMLGTEFGGMNEILADLYADTGDKRWLNLSHHFDHHAVVDPLKNHTDKLEGLHGNTQVPKLLGVLARYIYTGDKGDGIAANFFWDAVVNHHSFATGGHGKDEYFGPPDKLNERIDGRTAESCNVYNMQKMTKLLFTIQPDVKYAEFEERALFNHVLASIDPEDGRVCYMVNVGRGVQREYQNMTRDFTCCVGSGMENHALHADGIYYETGDKLWVNLYAPSTANWKAKGVDFAMETNFPEGESATLKITTAAPKSFTLALRRPSWAGEGFSVKVNGKPVDKLSNPASYVEIKRSWKKGDTVTIALPKTLRTEPLPDNPNRVALMWGPLVLAGDLGPERRNGQTESTPVFVAAQMPLTEWLKPVSDKPGNFRAVGRNGNGEKIDVDFAPFYRLHRRTYSLYWDLLTPQQWDVRAAEIAAAKEKQRKLEAATISFLQPGELQAEKDFNQQGEETSRDRAMGRSARRARKWFSFDLPVNPANTNVLIVTYNNEERAKRTFEILVDGVRVGEHTIARYPPGSATEKFYDVEYAIPAEILKGKQKVTVRFQATNNNETAAIYGIRVIRADAER